MRNVLWVVLLISFVYFAGAFASVFGPLVIRLGGLMIFAILAAILEDSFKIVGAIFCEQEDSPAARACEVQAHLVRDSSGCYGDTTLFSSSSARHAVPGADTTRTRDEFLGPDRIGPEPRRIVEVSCSGTRLYIPRSELKPLSWCCAFLLMDSSRTQHQELASESLWQTTEIRNPKPN